MRDIVKQSLDNRIRKMAKKLRIHYFQHVHFEGLGCIEDWINEKEHVLTSTKFYQNDKLPILEEIDWLIIMGGPMGVYDESKYDWLKAEKKFIDRAIKADKVVIGICLGSQLIAEVLGSKVHPNGDKEIGWFPIRVTEVGEESKFSSFLPPTFKVFHWHGDTYDLPRGAKCLLESAGCKNQAFLYSDRVLALQFHFEVTAETIKEMVFHGQEELVVDKYVQSAEVILATDEFIETNNRMIFKILDKLQS